MEKTGNNVKERAQAEYCSGLNHSVHPRSCHEARMDQSFRRPTFRLDKYLIIKIKSDKVECFPTYQSNLDQEPRRVFDLKHIT